MSIDILHENLPFVLASVSLIAASVVQKIAKDKYNGYYDLMIDNVGKTISNYTYHYPKEALINKLKSIATLNP